MAWWDKGFLKGYRVVDEKPEELEEYGDYVEDHDCVNGFSFFVAFEDSDDPRSWDEDLM